MKMVGKLIIVIIMATIAMILVKAGSGDYVKSFLITSLAVSGNITEEAVKRVSTLYALIYVIIWGISLWVFQKLISYIGNKVQLSRNKKE